MVPFDASSGGLYILFEMRIDDLLKRLVTEGASDLHLKPMRPAMLRSKGKLIEIDDQPLPPAVVKEALHQILTDRQREELEEKLYLDFGYSLPGISRFRGAIYFQRGTLAAVFRRVPFEFPTLEEWGLPEVLKEFAKLNQGLVLVTGPAGAGKSSTLAALIREIVDTRFLNVVTIEDPIEFLLSDRLGSVSQREVGTDTRGFAEALRNTLRQDPDVIMVGEMRDLETIATVLTAAETGHLVLSTLHANSASQTIDRIIDAFPEGQQRQVRVQLGQTLQGVVCLQLVERSDGSGMVAAIEILRNNPRVSKLIGDGKITELHEEMERSVMFEKMQTMNQSLVALVLNGVVTREAALAHSPTPADFAHELGQSLLEPGRSGKEGENDMSDSSADFSKILELREIRKLYEESQERFRQDMADRDSYIESLKSQMKLMDTSGVRLESERTLKEERDKLIQQLAFQKQEFEAKVEKLQLRIKDLSSQTAGAGDPSRSGFFRR